MSCSRFAAPFRAGTVKRIRWTAGPDGIAHAHPSGSRVAARGTPVVGERFAWPTHTRCPACLRVTTTLLIVPDTRRYVFA